MGKDLQPILKWVGGKRKLLPSIKPVIANAGSFNRYIEPFIGGGAVLLSIQPSNAIINDSNDALINLYQVIRNKPDELIAELERHKLEHCKEHFLEVRSMDRSDRFHYLSDVVKAARIIYLNKTCFNGLYRVNRKGQFNTPLGSYKNPKILEADAIWGLSEYLKKNKVEMLCGDFREALALAEEGDFVYLDPPYVPISETANFTGYTAARFGHKDQVALHDICADLDSKGIKFLLSNSDCEAVTNLYSGFHIQKINVTRSVNNTVGESKFIQEVLISNY